MTKPDLVNKRPITLTPIAVFEGDHAKELRAWKNSAWASTFSGLMDFFAAIFKSLH